MFSCQIGTQCPILSAKPGQLYPVGFSDVHQTTIAMSGISGPPHAIHYNCHVGVTTLFVLLSSRSWWCCRRRSGEPLSLPWDACELCLLGRLHSLAGILAHLHGNYIVWAS
jgi:hypothetical protein